MTPEEEDQVRRALAALAGSEPAGPLPEQVGSRLDDVLAGLVAERAAQRGAEPARQPLAGTAGAGPADELAQRRRRRWPQAVVAAAAVVVVAAGAVTVVNRGLGGSDQGSSSSAARGATGSAAPGARSSRAAAGARTQPDGATGTAPTGGAGPSPLTRRLPSVASGSQPLPPLSSAQLHRDVQALVDRGALAGLAVGGGDAGAAVAPCVAPPTAGGGQLLGVRLDGRRATLLLTRPVSGRRVARVYACGDAARPVATTTVHQPARSR